MQKVVALPSILVMVVLAFATALTAFAYEELEIEIETLELSTKVMISYEVEDETVKAVYTYNTTDRDEVYEKVADKLDLTVDEVKEMVDDDASEEDEEKDSEDAAEAIEDAEAAIAKAEAFIATVADEAKLDSYESWLTLAKDLLVDANEAFDDEEYADAKADAEYAEKKAKYVYEDEDYKDDDKDRGYGNNSDRCDEDNPSNAKLCKDSPREKLSDRFKNFGTTTDRDELQAQLRELMTLLIELLKQARINF